MTPEPPPGQGPVDPRGAFSPPPPPGGLPPRPGGMPPPGFGPPVPPPMFMPPPPRERSFARAILVTLATTIFGLSLLANVYLLMYSGLVADQRGSLETAISEGSASQKIAVIPVQGIIMPDTAAQVKRWLKMAERDANVKAVVLEVETPGGTVTASDEIHHHVMELKKARGEGFPVAVSMGSMATSGGYYVSAGADRIFAQPTTLTGNIGVLMPRYDLSELAQKWGIRESAITAPESGFKNAGSLLQPATEQERVYFQGLIDQTFEQFKAVVLNGRAGKLKASQAEIFDGRVFTAQDAEKNGLIDEIGYAEQAYEWAAKQANLSEPMVVRYQRRLTLLERAMADSGMDSPSATAKLDLKNASVNVKLDPGVLDSLGTPRLMYLWRGQ